MRLNLSSSFSCDLVHDVLSGELVAALVIQPPESGKLTGVKIDESPLFVVMSRDDELASLPFLRLEHLANRRWLMFQRNSHPPLYDLIFSCAQNARVIPSAIQHFMVPEETIPLLMTPHGIVIAPKSGALRIARDGYTMRPIEEERLLMSTLLISRSNNTSPALEIRNPLDALDNLIYLRLKQAGEPEKVRQYLRLAREQTAILSQISATVLDFARCPLLPKPTCLVGVAEAALRIHQKAIEAKKINIVKNLPERLNAQVYSGEILQLVSNLIANALDALPFEGTLWVKNVGTRYIL
jgi:signal transduction histidine kinase